MHSPIHIIGCMFILPHLWLPDLKTFQYNYPIFKCGLKETKLSTFCSEPEKSLLYTEFITQTSILIIIILWNQNYLIISVIAMPNIILGDLKLLLVVEMSVQYFENIFFIIN
jgi:hypothetical protein